MNETIPIDQIKADRQAQPRVEVNQLLVDEYAEAMSRGEAFPPVVVFHDVEVFWLADGFHRYHAALQAEVQTIAAEVHPGGLREAILFSVGMLPKSAPASVLLADNHGHSVKPEEMYRLIDEEMYPDQPGYLELFARRPPSRPRWVVWGNEPALAVAGKADLV